MVTTVRVYINILNYISTQNIPLNSTSTFQSNNFPNLGGCFFERILFERILFGNYNIISFELRTFGFYTFKQNIFLPFLSIPIIQNLSEGTVCKQSAPPFGIAFDSGTDSAAMSIVEIGTEPKPKRRRLIVKSLPVIIAL